MKNVSKRMQAVVMSAILASVAVPASMISTASAVFAPSAVEATVKTASTALKAGVDLAKESIPTKYDEKNPLKNIIVNITSDVDGEVSFSYGFGITGADGWLEFTEDGEFTTGEGSGYAIKLKKGENQVVIDLSDVDLQYGEYGNFEFRCYYCSYWDNSKKDMVATNVTFNGYSYNNDATVTTPDPDKPDTPDKPAPEDPKESIVPDNNKHTNGTNSESGKNWSFKDNGDGTATISSTVAKQIDGEALGDIVLTKGYDEDYYAAHPDDSEDRPINSHKFKFSDFGLTDMDGVIIESLTCTIESDIEMDQIVYGGGINVKKESPADTEYAKQVAGIEGKENAAYWYNDMGAEGDGSVAYYEGEGVEFGITPGNGGTLVGAGTYAEVYWEVPAEVQPYVSDSSTDTVSFQYWYGDTTADGEYAEVESVRLTNAVLTYTKTVTVPYDGSVATAVKKTINHTGNDAAKNLEIDYADLGVDETKDVYAIKFEVSANAPIGKLIYNVGTGVDKTVNSEYWFQEAGNYAILDADKSADIMWIAPTAVAGDEAHPNGINTKDGKLLIGYYYGEADEISVDNIEIYYAETPTTTATTTVTTTEKPTTTTTMTTTTVTTTESTTTVTTTAPVTTAPVLQVTLWGDANEDGEVDLADAVAIIQHIGNEAKYALSEQGALNANVVANETSGITGADAMLIQRMEAGQIAQSAFPISQDEYNAL